MLPESYAGNDTAHLWGVGIPCVLYGPGGGDGTAEEADHFVSVSEMLQCAEVLAATAAEVCGAGEA